MMLSDDSGPDDNPFWRFSLDRYRREGVAPLCLRLQDEAGADVNLVFFCLWLAGEGYRIDGDRFTRLVLQPARAWHEDIVRPLRAVRRLMKGREPVAGAALVEPVRQKVQAAEIATERLEQALLFAIFEAEKTNPDGPFRLDPTPARVLGVRNVATYFACAERAPEAVPAGLLDALAGLCL